MFKISLILVTESMTITLFSLNIQRVRSLRIFITTVRKLSCSHFPFLDS